MGKLAALALLLAAAVVVLSVLGLIAAPFAIALWIVEAIVKRPPRRGIVAGETKRRIARPADALGRWVEVCNFSYEPMFYGEMVRPTARSPYVLALKGWLSPAAFSPALASDLARKHAALRNANGQFPTLALTDPGKEVIMRNISDTEKIKALSEQLPTIDMDSALRITMNSREITLASDKAKFDEEWAA